MKIEIDTEHGWIKVGTGLRISFGLLELMDEPDEAAIYRLHRSGETLYLEVAKSAEGAMKMLAAKVRT